MAVIVWGEFGRTPRVNKLAGRDHWPRAGFALMAGGKFQRGKSSARPIDVAKPPSGSQ